MMKPRSRQALQSDAEAPATVVKKIENTEKTISELRSVKKLTKPSFKMSGCNPPFCAAASVTGSFWMGSSMVNA